MANVHQPKVTIVKDKERVVSVKIMQEAIVEIASAARTLLNSRLTKRAIVVLIKDSIPGSGITMRDIELVLEHAAKLDKNYLKS